MTSALALDFRDGVAHVVIDLPGAEQNTLHARFADEFDAVMDSIESRSDVRAVVISSGKPGSFVAGADVTMLRDVTTAEQAEALSRRGQRAFDRLAGFGVPVVAAIDGACLGGGLELALACHARVASDDPTTKLGLPEVQLGLLPGAGGTQRLPRLIGIAAALDLMLTGRQLSARRARSAGLVDEVVASAIVVQAAVKRALALAEQPATSVWDSARARARRLGAQGIALETTPVGRALLFKQARSQAVSKTRGNYPAHERILDVVAAGASGGFQAGLDAEAKAFGELVVSPVAANLMSIFFAQTALKKDRGVDSGAEARPVRHVGVIGAGLMGAGVAWVTLDRADIDVRLRDRDAEGLQRGLHAVRGFLSQRVKRRALTRHEADRQLRRITTTVAEDGMAGCDVVVEAVFEDLALKHRMIRDVEASCGPDTIFASNTSSLPISRIAEGAARPQNVIGMHYFSPVEKMPLLEIIVTDATSDDVTATCVALGKAQGKTVIVVRDGVGFYTSRILAPYMNEAAWVLSEGVAIEAIDAALVDWGFPVGPITLLDEVGIDVAAKVGPIMVDAFGARMEPPDAADRVLADGRTGRKGGRGFYRYDKKYRGRRPVDESVYDVLGITPGATVDAPALAERCALQMINEAVYCLQEDILRSPRDGDIGAIFGLGFPPFRGGPFRYVDAIGADRVVARLERLAERHGLRFKPAPMLADMARNRARFHAS